MVHRFYGRIRNSWFVVWGKSTRGLGEINSWFGEKFLVVWGKSTRGLGEINSWFGEKFLVV
jgi:hypothetical protein